MTGRQRSPDTDMTRLDRTDSPRRDGEIDAVTQLIKKIPEDTSSTVQEVVTMRVGGITAGVKKSSRAVLSPVHSGKVIYTDRAELHAVIEQKGVSEK